jgi:DNA-binding transcriptional LysR family regulator
MELRHLRYFIAVAETLHFGQAALGLRIAQPSLSHQIRQLEAELQTVLLRRTKRRVELTDAGRLLLQDAREIVAHAERAAVETRRLGRSEGLRLRVGVGYCMDHFGVATAVGRSHERLQGAYVDVRMMSAGEQVAALRAGRLDVGFVRPPVDDPALLYERLKAEHLIAALPHRHRLASAPEVELSSLAQELFVLPTRDTVPVLHDAILKACMAAGFVPDAPNEADHLQMILWMVAAGVGVALVPANSRRYKPARVVLRSLQAASPQVETVMAWRKDNRSRALAEFLGEARAALSR